MTNFPIRFLQDRIYHNVVSVEFFLTLSCFFSFFQTPITYYAMTWRFILINILCKCCYDWSSCYIPGESVRAGSDGKTPENGRKLEAVIR
jgi:hypothetical protein